jgi:RHS repeat-associated protein
MSQLVKRAPDASLNQPAITYTYTQSGQRASMTDASGTTVYQYDNRHRLISKATPNGTLTYTYDGVGNLASLRSSNANGASVDYSYNQLNRLSTVTDNRLGGGTTSYTYDAIGTMRSYVLTNGVKSNYSYDALMRLTNLTVKNLATATIADYAYTLGPAGNRLAVTELSGRHVAYTYDDVYRLSGETISNDPAGTTNGAISYSYDNAGNRLNRSSTVSAVPSATYQYDANDRLTANSYDANGNLIAQQGNTYSYDFEDRLAEVNNGNVSMVHDGDGQLVSQTVNGVTTKFLISEVNPTGYPQVVEELVNGSTQRVYTYGLMLLNQNQFLNGTWSASFYGLDGHSNVRFLTDVTGTITDTYDYDAFGNLIAATGTTPNTRLYTGEKFDPNVGFYHLRARYYDQAAGRFITRDKFPSAGYDPQSLHRYVYAQNNPANRIDPSGNMSTIDTLVTVGMIGILASSAITMVSLHAMTYYYLPSDAFRHMPDAAVGGLQFTGSPTKFIAKRGGANIYAEALAVALLLTTISAGAEVLIPFHSPAIWSYGYVGANFSLDNLTGDVDITQVATYSVYAGAVWNVKSPDDYTRGFFCSQATSQLIKGAITHMDFSWFRNLGPNFRDPLTLNATLCASGNERQTYSLTFGRQSGNNPRFSMSSSWFYYLQGPVLPYGELTIPPVDQ